MTTQVFKTVLADAPWPGRESKIEAKPKATPKPKALTKPKGRTSSARANANFDRWAGQDPTTKNLVLDLVSPEAIDLLKEARKIIRASASRNLVKDWDERATRCIAAHGFKGKT